jgi:signal transduction histidine kinase
LLLVATAGALLRFTRRAQRLARLQLDFVAGISHELRTPLAVIYGAAYNLRGSVAQNPGQVERYGALLQQESGRLRDLVEQVLRFSSAEAGNVIREREPISIHDLIDQAMESSKAVIQSAHCDIETKVDADLPIVLGDPIALKHALQNLVGNAAKYGQNGYNGGHWIGVFASSISAKRDLSVEIRVADRGPGIPEDEKQHVFDAFFRGRRAIQDQIHGTGLGLNLVKKIIEAHGGSIRVESEPMKRTEFIIRLPATNVGARE